MVPRDPKTQGHPWPCSEVNQGTLCLVKKAGGGIEEKERRKGKEERKENEEGKREIGGNKRNNIYCLALIRGRKECQNLSTESNSTVPYTREHKTVPHRVTATLGASETLSSAKSTTWTLKSLVIP